MNDKLQMIKTRNIVIVVLGSLLFVACQQDEVIENIPVYSSEAGNVEVTKDVTIYYSDSAITRVIVTGPKLLNYTERNQQRKEFPDGIRVEFFNDVGAISSILTAKYAVQYEIDNKVIVRDSVVWRSSEDQQLETTELIWDERQELVYTNKFSVITTPSDTIFTQYFKARQDFSEIIMTSTDGAIIVDDLSGSQN